MLLAKTVPPLSNPAGLVCDPAGALFVSDADECAVYKVALGTGEMTLLAGSPGECGFVDSKGAAARLRPPGKMASDDAGNLYVADPDNHAVRRVALTTGTVTTAVGAPEPFDVVILGALPAHLNRPSGLAYLPGVGLFIADANENAILLAGL
jgi:DNA-binding beta-propeller fold protein YncE